MRPFTALSVLLAAATVPALPATAKGIKPAAWLKPPCSNRCEDLSLPRSFHVTDVEFQAVGGPRAGYGILKAKIRWVGAGEPPARLTVDPFLLKQSGVPLGGGQGAYFGWDHGRKGEWTVLLNPNIDQLGCPSSLGDRLLLGLRWGPGERTEGHYLHYGVRTPQSPCPVRRTNR